MRAIGMLAVLFAVPAAADPPKGSLTLPDIVKEAVETAKLVEQNGSLGIDGTVAAGIVIKPPYHPDAEPVHRGGSWIVPPDPNDPMALEMGTNSLPWRDRVEPWLPRDLSRQLKRAADKVWDVMLPKL
ncbi:MAG: hypothetical protein M4D80_09175 [Myxococcota bacterium]|nr:hypothetical protein [Myxococcota bacterium]